MKIAQAVAANLTFTIGQLEELKSNINDTLRYIKQNQDKWDTKEEEATKNESPKEESVTAELIKQD
jgi:hypothetical protein|tara:strand:+ start:422 stop:619 length:198 start_codon:yes stop_codon:yes gene_type:complete